MYREVFKALIEQQAGLYAKVCAGDDGDVRYSQGHDKAYGTYDKNYINRLRLAYYLLFAKADREELVARLFEEELRDRETNSFQGIGAALEVLSYLLMKYNQDGKYNTLFERAENANFDCACGYRRHIRYPAEIADCDLGFCIAAAADMECPDAEAALVELWKAGVTDWTEKDYRRLIVYQTESGREVENELPLKEILAIQQKKGKNFDCISAWKDLIAYYVKFDQCEQAYQSFQGMLRSTDLAAVSHINLFQYVLETCMELICKDAEHAEDLWAWAKPHLLKKADHMYGNLYQKSIAAAEAVGDGAAAALRENYEVWKARMGVR